jgi:hypothetical protein
MVRRYEEEGTETTYQKIAPTSKLACKKKRKKLLQAVVYTV